MGMEWDTPEPLDLHWTAAFLTRSLHPLPPPLSQWHSGLQASTIAPRLEVSGGLVSR